MLGISLRDHFQNKEIRRRTRMDDVIGRIGSLKWSWVRRVTRQNNDRWTMETKTTEKKQRKTTEALAGQQKTTYRKRRSAKSGKLQGSQHYYWVVTSG